jgi:anti-anti-sigma factor
MVTDNSLRMPVTADGADLAFSIDAADGGSHIRLCGELDGETVALFTYVLDAQIDHGHHDVSLDVAGLTFFDVRGFSAVCAAQRRLLERGGRLRVINGGRLFHVVAEWWGVPELCDDASLAPPTGTDHRVQRSSAERPPLPRDPGTPTRGCP